MPAQNRRRRPLLQMLVAVVLMAGVVLAACGEPPPPTPPPSPTPPPTPTPTLEEALDGAVFAIRFNDEIVAAETIRVGREADQLVLYSELHRLTGPDTVERRTLVLTDGLTPLRYDVTAVTLGARSVWVAEPQNGQLHVLSNDQGWLAPVLHEGLTPVPDLFVESRPSALPYALLAMRQMARDPSAESGEPLSLHAVDPFEALPASRPLVLTPAPEREGAVIGTVAFEGTVEGATNPAFTLWVRPATRALYGVEYEAFRHDPWTERALPTLAGEGRLRIQRVSAPPEPPPPEPLGEARREAFAFTGADGTARAGTLVLPAGSGPHPVLLLHPEAGPNPRWDPGDTPAERGWAAYSFDKGGLGESGGEYDRDALLDQADEVLAAVTALRARADIDAERVVLVGLGDGAYPIALAAPEAQPAGLILASAGFDEPPLPALSLARIAGPLTAHYDWSPDQAAAYRERSVTAWQQWLFEGLDEVSLLRRRASLRALAQWAKADPAAALARAQAPVLLLHGADDAWTPLSGAEALERRLGARATLVTLADRDHRLGPVAGRGWFHHDTSDALFSWLETLP